MKNPLYTWFDRIAAYRIAAAIITVAILLGILSLDLQWLDVPVLVRRVMIWVGGGILLAAVVRDWFEVYCGKRDIEKRIREVQDERDSTSN